MTKSVTLSVVLPNYNHGRFIGRALRALLAQERPADEIIVIDDGSTDDSVNVIEQIAATVPSIRLLINPKNLGVIATLKRGLQAANGRYVYFGAADDWVLPGFFERALQSLEAAAGPGLYCGEAVLVDGCKFRPIGIRPGVRPKTRAGHVTAEAAQRLLGATDNWILTCSAVFRRDCVLQAGGFHEQLGAFADGYVARKVALQFGFIFEPKPMACWVISTSSVSRTTALELERSKHTLQIATQTIAADQAFPPWYAEAFGNRWRFAVCRLALDANRLDRPFLLSMGARSPPERAQAEWILALFRGKVPRLIMLTWLWYRLRPASLSFLLQTIIRACVVRLARMSGSYNFAVADFIDPANKNSLQSELACPPGASAISKAAKI